MLLYVIIDVLPKTRLDLVDIALTDHIDNIDRKQHFVVRGPEMAQSVLPKQLCKLVAGLGSVIPSKRYRIHPGILDIS